jgi:hypothetical protein
MSSFYDSHDKVRTQTRLQPKMGQPHNQIHANAFGHISTGYPAIANINKDPVDPCEANHADATSAVSISRNGSVPVHTTRQPVLIPLRRIAKCTITPTISAISVAVCLVMNTIVSAAVPETISPSLVTQWGFFFYIWSFLTLIQLITQSVYMCSAFTVGLSMLHLMSVIVVAILPIHTLSLFSFSMTLFVMCTIITMYQGVVFSLVYSHVAYRLGYVVVASIFIILPIIQLAQIDYIDKNTTSYSSMCSAISIFSMYAFAFVNGIGALTVDVSVATNPTWLQE